MIVRPFRGSDDDSGFETWGDVVCSRCGQPGAEDEWNRCAWCAEGQTVDVSNVEVAGSWGAGHMQWSATFTFPYRLQSSANLREDWRVAAKRKKEEREAIYFAWVAAGKPRPPCRPIAVRFTRIAPSTLDSDNIATAFKAMRDQIARDLGLKGDGMNDGADWSYGQEKQGAGVYGVRIDMSAEVRR